MDIGNAREDQKMCLHTIISGIWLIAWQPSLCSVCEGYWSCGRGRRKKKEKEKKKEKGKD
jgi:hypothetical protein